MQGSYAVDRIRSDPWQCPGPPDPTRPTGNRHGQLRFEGELLDVDVRLRGLGLGRRGRGDEVTAAGQVAVVSWKASTMISTHSTPSAS